MTHDEALKIAEEFTKSAWPFFPFIAGTLMIAMGMIVCAVGVVQLWVYMTLRTAMTDANFDDSTPITIAHVGSRLESGWWNITDSLGRKFRTKNILVVTLAKRYMDLETPCRPITFSGWFYRELLGLNPVEKAQL